MIQLTFLLGASLTFLLGTHHIQAQLQPEDLPKGDHTITLIRGEWGTGGLCGYIYGLDKGKFPPRQDTFKDCKGYETDDHMYKFESDKPGEINARIFCSYGQEAQITLKKIGNGRLTENNPGETFEGKFTCH